MHEPEQHSGDPTNMRRIDTSVDTDSEWIRRHPATVASSQRGSTHWSRRRSGYALPYGPTASRPSVKRELVIVGAGGLARETAMFADEINALTHEWRFA